MPNLVQELNSLDFSVYIGGPLQAAVQAQHAASMSQVSFIQAVGFEEDSSSTTTPKAQKLRYVDFAYAKSVPNPDFGKTYEQLIAEGRVSETSQVKTAKTNLNTAQTALDTAIAGGVTANITTAQNALTAAQNALTAAQPDSSTKASAISTAKIDTTNKFIENNVTIKVPFLTMLIMPAIRIEEITIDFNAKLTSTETSSVSSEFAASAELGVNYKKVNFKATASYKRTSSSGTAVEKTYNLGVHVKAVNDELPAGLDRILTMLEDSIASVNG